MSSSPPPPPHLSISLGFLSLSFWSSWEKLVFHLFFRIFDETCPSDLGAPVLVSLVWGRTNFVFLRWGAHSCLFGLSLPRPRSCCPGLFSRLAIFCSCSDLSNISLTLPGEPATPESRFRTFTFHYQAVVLACQPSFFGSSPAVFSPANLD